MYTCSANKTCKLLLIILTWKVTVRFEQLGFISTQKNPLCLILEGAHLYPEVLIFTDFEVMLV